MSAQAALPSAEALALSAAAFSASIDAWIPAGWGASSSSTSKSSELTLSGFGGANDRLGLGHPLLDQANKRPATSGLGALGKKLAKRPKRDDEPISVAKPDDDESEEEESRAGAFKSKSTGRGRGLEMLSQRKRKLKGAKEAEHPAALLSKAPTTSSPSSLVAVTKGDSTEIDAARTEKFEPPASNHSERTNTRNTEAETAEGVASDEKRECKEDGDDDDDPPQAIHANGGDGPGTLSKTQQRRLKRKAAKLAKKAREEAGKRK